jgi:diguanylate cyclase (GGDEF)-like protein
MLIATADLLRETFREEDVVARIGGDRFAVFAPSPPERAQIVRERLRAGCEQINKRAELPGALSISIGFASVSPSDERPLESLLAVADERRREDKLSKNVA